MKFLLSLHHFHEIRIAIIQIITFIMKDINLRVAVINVIYAKSHILHSLTESYGIIFELQQRKAAQFNTFTTAGKVQRTKMSMQNNKTVIFNGTVYP